MLGQEHPTLQEADQDYGRPAELGEGEMFEMERKAFVGGWGWGKTSTGIRRWARRFDC